MGSAIRLNRMRAGLTQVQLGRAVSRSGKFISEVENGKARVCDGDLERLAETMGVTPEALREGEMPVPTMGDGLGQRRIRELHPTGLTILGFGQLLNHVDRSGWLRNAKLWMISGEPFPEEGDLALVEQLASTVTSKNVSLRYMFGVDRVGPIDAARLCEGQGSFEVLPGPLSAALRWSQAMRAVLREAPDRVSGFALSGALPDLCRSHVVLWIETEDVSWSDVMPLLYCRGVTRTFEKPNESTAFWYQLPREEGSRLLLDLAQRLKVLAANGRSS